jgi:hypothetical protein
MSVGYGRGYYGTNQLVQEPRQRGSLWGKIAIVAGIGAVVWLMWPRRAEPQPHVPPSPQLSPPQTVHVALAAAPQPAELDQLAKERGYASTQAYEDAVVSMVKQLQDAGAKVVLEPHLAHLAPRLASSVPGAPPLLPPA